MDNASFQNRQTEELRERVRSNASFVARNYKSSTLGAPTKFQLVTTVIGWLGIMGLLIVTTDVFTSSLSTKHLPYYCSIVFFTSMLVWTCVAFFRSRKTKRQ
jgi:hypothetical protein